MANPLDERLENSPGLKNDALDAIGKAKQPGSIDNVVENPKKKTNSIDDKFSTKKFLWDAAKFAPIAYGVYNVVQGAFTPLMTIAGFVLGNLWDAKKKKQKVSYNSMKKDVQTATVLGASDYWFWKIPDIIPNATIPGMIAKTLFAIPVLGMPYLFIYNHTLNLRDNYGLKKTVKGLFTGETYTAISKYHKDAWKNSKNQMKDLFKIWPIYFFGFNVLSNIYHRVGVSIFNNFFLKMITSKSPKSEKAKEEKKKDGIFKKIYDAGKVVKDHYKDKYDNLGKYFAPGKNYAAKPA